MSDKIILPPAGRRKKNIVIQGLFKEETEEEKNERNELIAKNFLSFGNME